MRQLSFEEWLGQVNRALGELTSGMVTSIDELIGDLPYYNFWCKHANPTTVARKALKEARSI